jgi:tetratricopeptide (TPR) repeat protein
MLLVFGLLKAQTPEDYFKKGNETYKKGDYQSAVSDYEKALQSDKIAPELFFNLGNAYYKLNRIAPSIFYYEKALKLNPADEDIAYNLKLANQMKLDKIEQVPDNVFLRLKKSINKIFNYETWAWISIFGAWLGLVAFIWFLFTRNANQKRIAFITMWLSLFIWLFAWYNADFGHRLAQVKYGIIFTPKVDLMTEPNLTSDVVINLHEGSKVKILKDDADWYLVKLPDGKKAWIPKADVKIID